MSVCENFLMKKELPLSELQRIYQPGSLLLLGTQLNGRANVMALAWHTLLEDAPARIACILRSQGRTFQALQQTGECVLNMPLDHHLEQVLLCGSLSGHDADKLALCGWSTRPAGSVQVPLLSECQAHVECRVLLLEQDGDYNLCLLEPQQLWVDQQHEPDWQAGQRLDLWLHGRSLLGGALQRLAS